jgi:hypothetical protein
MQAGLYCSVQPSCERSELLSAFFAVIGFKPLHCTQNFLCSIMDQYIKQLTTSGNVAKVAIINDSGAVLAATPGFSVSKYLIQIISAVIVQPSQVAQEDLPGILQLLQDPTARPRSFRLGVYYVLHAKEDDGLALGGPRVRSLCRRPCW